MNRSCMFSLRLPVAFLENLEKSVKEEKFESVSQGMRYYIELGMLAESFKPSVKDPEFVKSIKELKQNDGLFDWIETLTFEQADAIASALEMTRANRIKKMIR